VTVTVLDGPLGTELDRRGVDTSLPLWSARALLEADHLGRVGALKDRAVGAQPVAHALGGPRIAARAALP